jgi:outer membrane biogenesis lipoprotein LolB
MSKKIFFLGIVTIVLFSSCKTTKSTGSTIKNYSAKKIIKAHQKAIFSQNTIQAKIKAHYQDDKNSQSLTIKLRIKKDEVIWMSGTFLGIPVAKVKITPTSVQYYEKLNKTYFSGDFSLISNALGFNLDFQQLQNILLGQAIFNLNSGKFKSHVNQESYLITPKNQQDLFDIYYWVNPLHFKLNKQEVKSLEQDEKLSIAYTDYQKVSGEYFPKIMEITAAQTKQITRLKMEYRSLVFNKKLTFPFSIPTGYKKITISDL